MKRNRKNRALNRDRRIKELMNSDGPPKERKPIPPPDFAHTSRRRESRQNVKLGLKLRYM